MSSRYMITNPAPDFKIVQSAERQRSGIIHIRPLHRRRKIDRMRSRREAIAASGNSRLNSSSSPPALWAAFGAGTPHPAK
jgi:hypothetical protein